jgi:hypothetical protein
MRVTTFCSAFICGGDMAVVVTSIGMRLLTRRNMLRAASVPFVAFTMIPAEDPDVAMAYAQCGFRNCCDAQMKEPREGIMQTYKEPVRTRGLGIASVIFGLLGGAFCWWTPLGMIFSLTGLVMGYAGWAMSRRTTRVFGLSIAGILISLATLILDLAIADLGLEFFKLQALR